MHLFFVKKNFLSLSRNKPTTFPKCCGSLTVCNSAYWQKHIYHGRTTTVDTHHVVRHGILAWQGRNKHQHSRSIVKHKHIAVQFAQLAWHIVDIRPRARPQQDTALHARRLGTARRQHLLHLGAQIPQRVFPDGIPIHFGSQLQPLPHHRILARQRSRATQRDGARHLRTHVVHQIHAAIVQQASPDTHQANRGVQVHRRIEAPRPAHLHRQCRHSKRHRLPSQRQRAYALHADQHSRRFRNRARLELQHRIPNRPQGWQAIPRRLVHARIL